jgi:hypothetical protein
MNLQRKALRDASPTLIARKLALVKNPDNADGPEPTQNAM